jgi:hypothetical protein
MRETIILKAWFWWIVLGAATNWCRFCRFLRRLAVLLYRWTRKMHKKADNLCGRLARRAAGDIGVVDPIDTYADPVEL